MFAAGITIQALSRTVNGNGDTERLFGSAHIPAVHSRGDSELIVGRFPLDINRRANGYTFSKRDLKWSMKNCFQNFFKMCVNHRKPYQF